MKGDPKIAIVHEWFDAYAGSERVVEQILACFPDADLFALVDFLPGGERGLLGGKTVRTSFIQRLPLARRHFRHFFSLMPIAVEQFDLSAYDIVISSSHAFAKGVLTGPDQLHVSYVHTPVRYAWDLQHQYLNQAGLSAGARGVLARWMLHRLRNWDYRTASGVDVLVANSRYVQRRIRKVYRRDAFVVYPPVDVRRFSFRHEKEDFYLAVGRSAPYKRMDLIVEAFASMPERKLVVMGNGPELARLEAKAYSNIRFMGYVPTDVLVDHMQRAMALVFAAEEDFGIIPVEAQACGTPVIAYSKGGATETVVNLDGVKPTGVLFPEQERSALAAAVESFERNRALIHPDACRLNAERFGVERFRSEFSDIVHEGWDRLYSEMRRA